MNLCMDILFKSPSMNVFFFGQGRVIFHDSGCINYGLDAAGCNYKFNNEISMILIRREERIYFIKFC